MEALTALWVIQFGTSMQTAELDLEALRAWFDPLARGERLRAQLSGLGDAVLPASIDEPYAVDAGDGRRLVTPEGRLLVDLLRSAVASPTAGLDVLIINSGQATRSERILVETYRSWAQRRLRDVIALEQGKSTPLLPQGIGQVLLLLLNGSVGAKCALRTLPDPAANSRVEDACAQVVEAFTNHISPPRPGQPRSRRHYSIYGGYALSEAKRRLGPLLQDVSNPDGTKMIFIREGGQNKAISRLSTELSRRRTRQLTRNAVESAVDAAIGVYQVVRPVLASYNLAFGREVQSWAVRDRLLQGLDTSESPSLRGDAEFT